MKNLIIILLLSCVALAGYGQKKGKVDPKDVQIDSLTKVSGTLTVKLDSSSAELAKYLGVYTSLKEKVFLTDFDPTKTSSLIDSLRTTRDATFTNYQDSLNILKSTNKTLQATIDSLSVNQGATSLAAQQEERARTIEYMKELKGLLDEKIITQAEFDTKKAVLLEKL